LIQAAFDNTTINASDPIYATFNAELNVNLTSFKSVVLNETTYVQLQFSSAGNHNKTIIRQIVAVNFGVSIERVVIITTPNSRRLSSESETTSITLMILSCHPTHQKLMEKLQYLIDCQTNATPSAAPYSTNSRRLVTAFSPGNSLLAKPARDIEWEAGELFSVTCPTNNVDLALSADQVQVVGSVGGDDPFLSCNSDVLRINFPNMMVWDWDQNSSMVVEHMTSLIPRIENHTGNRMLWDLYETERGGVHAVCLSHTFDPSSNSTERFSAMSCQDPNYAESSRNGWHERVSGKRLNPDSQHAVYKYLTSIGTGDAHPALQNNVKLRDQVVRIVNVIGTDQMNELLQNIVVDDPTTVEPLERALDRPYTQLMDGDALLALAATEPSAPELQFAWEWARNRAAMPDAKRGVMEIPVGYKQLNFYGRQTTIDHMTYQYCPRILKSAIASKYYHDLDLTNNGPFILYDLSNHLNVATPTLDEYVTDRESVLAMLSNHYGVSRDGVKNLMIRILYGGGSQAWRRKFNITRQGWDEIIDLKEERLQPSAIVATTSFEISIRRELRILKRKLLKLFPEARAHAQVTNLDSNLDKATVKRLSSEHIKTQRATALIIRNFENEMITAVETATRHNGLRVDALIFDGLMVRREPIGGNATMSLDLLRTIEREAAETRRLKQYGLKVRLAEKPFEMSELTREWLTDALEAQSLE